MAKLDDVIVAVNGDLQDCLSPVRDRFRLAMSKIFDYAVANPSQGSASTASAAIASAFKATYADGLVAPGITIEQAVTAFNNRHGVGANTNAKWVSVRNFIVARSAHGTQVKKWLEEGAIKPLPRLWLHLIRKDPFEPDIPEIFAPEAYTYQETKDAANRVTEDRYTLTARSVTIRIPYDYTTGNRVTLEPEAV